MGNKLHLHYKDKLANAAYGNNPFTAGTTENA
jgi:hypothetical protein